MKMIGKKVGHVTVVKFSHKKSNKEYYFECLCECGTVCIKRADLLYKPNSKISCGCKTSKYLATMKGKLAPNRVKDNSKSKEGLFKVYQNGAKARNLDFEIDFESFIKLTSENCSFCGTYPEKQYPPRQVKGTENPLKYYYYNGLDRIDPKQGYTINNVQPCCENCNYAKSDLSEEQFLNLVEKIYKKRFTT
jgi:hypothetical protein